MTIRHLEIFTTVADAGSMSKAAKLLHISQPGISQAVSELERYYSIKLFERLSQKLYLTKEGELLLSFSRHILDSFDKMEEAMHHATQKTSLHIGCSVSVGTCLINEILDEAEKQLPNCSFQVTVTNSTHIEQAILDSQVDVGIVEGTIRNENLIVLPVCEDELVMVCGKDHPLARLDSISLPMLQNQDYASRESGSTDRNQFEQLLEEQNIHLNRTFRSTSTDAIKNAVLCGRGIALFSKRMVAREVSDGDMVILPLEGIRVTRNIHFVIHKNKYVSTEIETLQKICSGYEKNICV